MKHVIIAAAAALAVIGVGSAVYVLHAAASSWPDDEWGRWV